jgi:hypothetical protein
LKENAEGGGNCLALDRSLRLCLILCVLTSIEANTKWDDNDTVEICKERKVTVKKNCKGKGVMAGVMVRVGVRVRIVRVRIRIKVCKRIQRGEGNTAGRD